MNTQHPGKPCKAGSIMIVDSSPDYSNTLRHAFEDRGYLTWTCPGPDIASCILLAIHPTAVVLDLDLEGVNPFDIMDAWRALSPSTRIVVEMRVPDAQRLQTAMDHGADTYFVKTSPMTPLFQFLEEKRVSEPPPPQPFNEAA